MAKSLESSSIDSFMEFFSIDTYFLSRKGEITEDQKKIANAFSEHRPFTKVFLKNSAAEIIFTPAVSLQCTYCILTMTNNDCRYVARTHTILLYIHILHLYFHNLPHIKYLVF